MRDYFEYLQKSLCVTKTNLIETLGGKVDHCFRWGSSQWDMPTGETYLQLIEAFRIDLLDRFKQYEELRQQYEELRQQYEELRRPFNPTEIHKMDVLDFKQ